jgi:hypothetical protein
MFQFPWFPPPALCIQAGVTLHNECWVSPFGHLRINAQSTAPRSFSQSLTSFIGSWRQGIHRWLFVAWKNKDARACSAVLKGQRRIGRLHPCSARHDCQAASERATQRVGSGADPTWGQTLIPCVRGNSLKTEEKTKAADECRQEANLRLTANVDCPTSAPTGNWFEPGRTNAYQRLNSSSLERR